MRRRPLPFVATDLLAVVATVLLLAGCGASTPAQDSGPELELVANGSGQWFVTSPDADLTAFDALRIVVVLENGTGADTTFVGDEEPQIWTTPSVDEPPVTFQVVPSGTFPAGALFAYDLTVDLSGLPPVLVHQRHHESVESRAGRGVGDDRVGRTRQQSL